MEVIVQQLVHMVIKALFTLPGAPDLNALLDKPLNHERRLVIPATQPVEHENEQNIELVGNSSFLDLHDGVPGVGTDLVSADTLFGNLVHDLPVGMLLYVFPAGFLLHRYVIVIHLSDRGNTVKANDPLQLRHLTFIRIFSASARAASFGFSAYVTVTLQAGTLCFSKLPACTTLPLNGVSIKLFLPGSTPFRRQKLLTVLFPRPSSLAISA